MVRVEHLAYEASRHDDVARLDELSTHRSPHVRKNVASNEAVGDETIARLLQDDDAEVRARAAGNLRHRHELRLIALRSPEPAVRAALAGSGDRVHPLSRDMQTALARDDSTDVRAGIAATTDSADLFEVLLVDRDDDVRAACARNPRITRDQMELLVTDRHANVRERAVSGGLLLPDDEQLRRLARDRSKDVRWAVIFRVDTPRDAVEWIAENDDEINSHNARTVLDGGIHHTVAASVRARRDALRGLEFAD